MKNYFFLLLSCLLSSVAFCTEPTSMIDAVMQNCSYDESQRVKLGSIPEFKKCQDWNAIQSISEFTEENKSNIKCLLYYESLISVCKDIPITELFDIVNEEPPVKTAVEVCEYFLKNENEFQVIKKVIKEKDICIYLCEEFVKPKLISDRICTESYVFCQYFEKNRPSDSPIESKESIQIPEGGTANENKQVVNGNQTQHIDNAIEKKPISSLITDQKLLRNGENVEISPRINIDHPVDSKADELKPSITNNSTQVSTPSSDDEVNRKPIVDVNPDISNPASIVDPKPVVDNVNPAISNPASIVDPVNDQQAPPINPNLTGQSTAQDQAYQDEDDGAYKIDADKEQKPENAPLETIQDGTDDFEELTQTKFKKPEVSRLSDAFGYDSDINGNSYFFSYFSFTCIVLVIGYVLYHNKQKVLALLVEGRHSRRPQRARRPNSASYHKLDSNLEEAISSSVSKNPSHVIY